MVGQGALAGGRFGVPAARSRRRAGTAARRGLSALIGGVLVRAVLAILLLAGGYAGVAEAQTPPTIEFSISPETVPVGGRVTVRVRVRNDGNLGNQAYSMVIPASFTYNYDLLVNGCSAEYSYDGTTYAMYSADISPGLTCTNTFSLTATAGGSYRFAPTGVSADGPSGRVTGAAPAPITVVVTSAPAVTEQPAGQTVAEGTSATFTAAASGTPTPTVQWQVSPDGIGFTNIAGATSPSYTTRVTAADNGERYRAVFTNSQGSATTTAAPLTVVRAPIVDPQSVTVAYQTPRAITVTASDPNTPPRSLTYAIRVAPAHGTLSGTLPNLTYTPVAGYTGSDSFVVGVSNGVASSPGSITIGVQPPVPVVTSVAPPSGVAGTSVTITGSGLSGASAVLFDSTAAQSYTVDSSTQITAVAPAGVGGTADVSVVAPGGTATRSNAFTYVVTVNPATVPGATVGQAYSQTVTATGGSGGFAYAVAGGTLPAGMTLSSAGSLAGTPTAGGTFNFTVRATDSGGGTGTRSYTLTVGAPAIALTPATLPDAVRGSPYSQTLTASAGTAPYSYSATGSVPPGLVLAAGGTLSGQPTATGSYTFTVTARDASTGGGPYSGSRTYTVVVTSAAIVLAPTAVPAAVTRVAYSQALTASGGTGPYRYAVTAGALPAGYTLAAGGTLAGSTTTAGTFGFTVTATDTFGNTGTRAYTLSVSAPAIALAPTTLPAATTRVAYSQSLAASGGSGSYTYAVTAGALPSGLTLVGNMLSGTAVAAGTFSFIVTATDGNGNTGAQGYTLSVNAPAIVLAPPTLPGATVASAYSQTFAASGGAGGYTYAVTAGAVPAGMTLSSAGAFGGTPTAGGTFTFAVTATDADGNSGVRSYTLAVAAPAIAIAPEALPAATTRVAYGQSLSASGGTAPYSYAVTAGALPAGITLATNGTLAGTSNAAGSYSFTVTARDSSTGGGPFSASRNYTLTVSAPAITIAPATLPAATTRVAYSGALSASGGVGTYRFAVTAGALPAGLTLTTAGTLSGSATAAGSFSFTVTATDDNGNTGARSYALAVAAPAITIAPASLSAATTRVAYSAALTASGGTGSYTYAVTAGALPAGITLATGGTLSGTATAAGSFAFTVTATDDNGNTGARSYTLAVAAPAITIAPASLSAATTRVAYSAALTASGGTGSYAYAVTAGALPAGITLAAGGTLSGTATAAGSFAFTVTATDANGNAGSRSYTLEVTAPAIVLAPATLADAQTAQPYTATLAASGGTAPYAFAIVAGTLPAGLTLGTDGALSGTPTAGGSFTFTARAADANGNTAARAYTLTVAAAPVVLAPATLPAGQVRAAYSQALSASGGTAPYGYAITAGALPTGLTLAANGTLAGTPVQSGSFTFTVAARDNSTGAGPFTGTRSYTLTIAAPALTLAPDALPGTARGAAYSQTLTTTGGTAPYSYAATGAVPPGLTLSTAGVLSGRATTAGSYSFTVTATDATSAGDGGPYAISRTYTVGVDAPTITLAPDALPTATTRIAYSGALTAAGGVAPYGYAVTSGALPAGITLSSGGTLSGTPTAAGSFGFTATATDANGNAGTRPYTLVVTAPAIALAPDALPAATTRVAYSASLSAAGGAAPYGYAVTAGALPGGITLSAGGALAGAPTAAGSFTFSVTATDANGNAGTRAYTLAVSAPAIVLAPPTLPTATTRVAYSAAVTAGGGTAPYAYAVTAGALPTGITLSAGGTLAGTTTAAGSFAFTVTATDTNGNSGSQAYTLGVTAPAVTLAPTTLPTGTTRVAYAQTLTAAGGTAPYRYAVTAGALPAGLALATDGTLSGSPTAAGSYGFTVTALDANGNAGAGTYTLTIAVPAIVLAPAALPGATVAAPYAERLTATGGTGAFSFAVTAGALPAGVTLGADGALAGTPTAGGSFAFTVAATDANGNSGDRSYGLTVAAPAIALAPATLVDATANMAYRQAVVATGGVAPYRYAVTAGALPAGVTLAADGTLSGTPRAAGTFGFTIAATDSGAGTGPYRGAQTYTLTVVAPTIVLAPPTLPAGTVGAAYAGTVTAGGGTGPYDFSVAGGALPAGIALSIDGTVSGTPAAAGSYDVTIRAIDANGNVGTGTYTIAIARSAQTIAFADPGATSLSDSPVTLTATASSGLAVSLTSATPGVCTLGGTTLTLVATGTCTVEATQAGNANIAAATPVSRSFTVTAARLVATVAQPAVTAQVGAASSPTTPVTAAGGTAPYGYALSGAPLPAGLSFSTATGTLSGTPTAGQPATVYTVAVTDRSGQSASGSFTLSVVAPALAITPATLPDGAFQTAYAAQLSAAGGTGPYRFAVTAGALPAGITLSADGALSGRPGVFGRFEVTITATDSSTNTGPFGVARAYTLTIAPPAVPTAGDVATTVAYGSAETVVTPTTGGEVTSLAIVRAPARGTARVEGRTLVYTPAGGFAGPDSFTYTAANAGGASAPATVSITVGAPAITITPSTLPGAQQDVAYTAQLNAAGGAAPYTFAVAGGTLPAGLTLSPAGVLSGTPTASGGSSFSVRVTDSSTGTGPFGATQTFTLTTAAPAVPTVRPLPTISAQGSSSAASATTRIPLSDYVIGNVTALEIATQPANGVVTLAQSGTQTAALYTPRATFVGTDSFAFVAVGPGGRSAVQTVTVTVSGTAPVAAALTASTTQGVPVTVDVTTRASGGPFTGAAVVAVTPAAALTVTVVEGGTAGARTYALTVTPAASFSGTATIGYTLSNQYGASTPATLTVSVAGRPDPAGDPTVNAVSTAQAEATRRFARTQTDNFVRRNEQLHHGGSGSDGRDMGVGLQFGDLARMTQAGVDPSALDAADVAMLKSEHARATLGRELASGAVALAPATDMAGVAGQRGRDTLRAGSAAAAGTPRGLAQTTGAAPGGDGPTDGSGDRRVGSVGVWSGGAVTVGTRDPDADRARMTLSTGGLSAGADVKLADTVIVGIGGGYGADVSRIGDDLARIRGRSWSLAGYGSWSPVDGMFVDGVIGAGEVSFDTRRRIAQTGDTAGGHRDGSMIFGSLAGGFDRRGTVDLSAYGRVDYLSARLDRYAETGGGIWGLTFGRRSLQSLAGVLGVRAAYPLGGWTPRVRGEWRHEFADLDGQFVDYSDVGTLRYATRGDIWLRNAFTIDLGAEFTLGRGWNLTTEIGGSAGSGATAATGRVGVRKGF